VSGPTHEIVFSRRAERELSKLAAGDRKSARRIIAAVEKLAANPRPSGVKKLRGSDEGDLYRIKVGVYRVVYAIEDARVIIEVLRVGHRREVYELFFRS
jgi:mRNA interferase RelE/StbE